MPELYGHPFSSYTWKALIPCYENRIELDFRMVDPDHPENLERLQALSPMGKFPLLVDGDTVLYEATIIIEYLQQAYPGPVVFIPDQRSAALEVRMLDRFFDNYVMGNMQHVVDDCLRGPADRCPAIVEGAKSRLERAYAWLDQRMRTQEFACGEHFTLADCAAAPALFYADWVHEISGAFPHLRRYRATLLGRASVTRCVEDARPYRPLFPGGAPDRD
ncbi:glutathione S-transferase family protein [Kineobactrum salinum]|uniref:Glutathione S-transferase family protein n=1 Tax=Kineobactrum salinum TaxID=2708301 RepID=A0A6C0U7Q9_9GAMM|nr:glutathione S-transferase family protein [Kineobactrum salinum]QIB66495.1 glutathione S-transferase family protein [Kineobactrum salinum]